MLDGGFLEARRMVDVGIEGKLSDLLFASGNMFFICQFLTVQGEVLEFGEHAETGRRFWDYK